MGGMGGMRKRYVQLLGRFVMEGRGCVGFRGGEVRCVGYWSRGNVGRNRE